jgi:hypothetical protein
LRKEANLWMVVIDFDWFWRRFDDDEEVTRMEN